jgi:hypothetical protein
VYRWEFEEQARREAESLPPHVRHALEAFMEAGTIVDPMEYQRRPGEAVTPMRMLPFGPQGDGLVTFLAYPPDDLVLVLRIHWLGE